MQVHCLTIPRNSHRMEVIRDAWKDFEIIEHIGLDCIDFQSTGFDAAWSQACCWYGHASIWAGLGSGWHLVIEDDAVPIANVLQAVQVASESDFDLVKLHHRIDYPSDANPRVIPLGLDVWISTTAYLIRNPCRLVERLRLGYIDRVLQDQFDVGCVIPKPVECGLGRCEPTSLYYP